MVEKEKDKQAALAEMEKMRKLVAEKVAELEKQDLCQIHQGCSQS